MVDLYVLKVLCFYYYLKISWRNYSVQLLTKLLQTRQLLVRFPFQSLSINYLLYSTQYLKIGRWGMECFNSRSPLPTLLYAGYSLKLNKSQSSLLTLKLKLKYTSKCHKRHLVYVTLTDLINKTFYLEHDAL